MRKRYGLFDAKRQGGGRNFGVKYAGFLPKVVAGLLDTVAVLSNRNRGGETAEGDDKAMGDAEGGDDPSDHQQWLVRGASLRFLNSCWIFSPIPRRGLASRRTSRRGTWLSASIVEAIPRKVLRAVPSAGGHADDIGVDGGRNVLCQGRHGPAGVPTCIHPLEGAPPPPPLQCV